MRVRLLQSLMYRQQWHPAKSVVDLPDGLAAAVIEGGAAEQVKALTAPPNIKAVLRPSKTKERTPHVR